MITREEIDKLIEENNGKEWRSYREFREYLDRNYGNNEFKIIGWVSLITISKWFKDGIIETPRKDTFIENENLWILTRGNNYWFVSLFTREPWKSTTYR